MARVYHGGQVTDIPEAEIAAALQEGTWQQKFGDIKDATVNVVTADGQVGAIPFAPDAVTKHFRQDARFETNEEADAAEGELQQKKEHFGGTAGELKATGLGLARGVSAGLSDYAIDWAHRNISPEAFASREELAGYQEANPKLSTGTEVLGMVGPALLSGGASALAQGGLKAGAMGIAKAAAARTLPGMIEKQVVKATAGRGLLAQAGVRMIEGGVYGALAGADSAFLRNQDIADEMVASGALGMLTGFATPLAFAGAGKAISMTPSGKRLTEKAAAKRAAQTAAGVGAEGAETGAGKAAGAAERAEVPLGEGAVSEAAAEAAEGKVAREAQVLGEIKSIDDKQAELLGFTEDEVEAVKAAKKLDEVPVSVQQKVGVDQSVEELKEGAGLLGRTYAKLVSKFSSMHESGMLRLLQKGPKGAEARTIAENSADFLAEAARSGADTETGQMRLSRLLGRLSRDKKARGMEHLVTAGYDESLGRMAAQELEGIEEELDATLARGVGDRTATKRAQALKTEISMQIKALEKIAADPEAKASHVFMNLDRAKQIMGRYTEELYRKAGTLSMETGAGPAMRTETFQLAQRYEEQYYRLRELLENEGVWGKEAAGAQREVNKSITGLIRNAKSEGKSIIREWDTPAGEGESAWERQFIADQGPIYDLLHKSTDVHGELDYRKFIQMQTLRKELNLKYIKHYKLDDVETWGAEALTPEKVKDLFGKSLFEKGGKYADLAGEKDVSKLVEQISDRHAGLMADGKQIRELGELYERAQKGGEGVVSKYLAKPGLGLGIQKLADRLSSMSEEAIAGIRKTHGAAEESLLKTHRSTMGSISGAGKAATETISGAGKAATETISGAGKAASETVAGAGREAAESISKAHGAAVESMSAAQKAALESMSQTVEAAAATRRAQARASAEAAQRAYQIIRKTKQFLGLQTAAVPALSWEVGKRHVEPKDEQLVRMITNPNEAGEMAKQHGLDQNPKLAGVMGALLATAPKPRAQYLYEQLRGDAPEIDRAALRQWKRDQVRIVRDPSSVVDLMNEGNLRPDHVELFKKAYPATYAGLVEQCKLWLAQGKSKIPQKKLEQMSILMGVPLTARADSRLARSNQDLYQQQGQEMQQNAQKRALSNTVAVSLQRNARAQMSDADKLADGLAAGRK